MWTGKKKYKEFVSSKEERKSYDGDESVSLMNFLDGSILTSSIVKKQLPLLGMLFLVCMIIITIRNYTEQAYRYKNKLSSEVKELRYESISISAGLMFISKQSEIVKRIEKDDLKLIESKVPPINIVVEEGNECQ